ncbi:MAG: hypothetical protein M0Z53_03460 [Thermaerobacter sp.]|nr:hypothetical protein [Thermaerobacter sp.]
MVVDESELRTDYWVDNRSNRQFPLWVVFRQIGQEPGQFAGSPYLRQSRIEVPALLQALEAHPAVPELARDLGIRAEEFRAMLWFLGWLSAHHPMPETWESWNRRVDEAWQNGTLQPDR